MSDTLELLERCLRKAGNRLDIETEDVPERDSQGRCLGVQTGGIKISFWNGWKSQIVIGRDFAQAVRMVADIMGVC